MEFAFDYSALEGRITEKLKTKSAYAEAIGITSKALREKLNGKYAFTTREIKRSLKPLGIASEDIPKYFFVDKV